MGSGEWGGGRIYTSYHHIIFRTVCVVLPKFLFSKDVLSYFEVFDSIILPLLYTYLPMFFFFSFLASDVFFFSFFSPSVAWWLCASACFRISCPVCMFLCTGTVCMHVRGEQVLRTFRKTSDVRQLFLFVRSELEGAKTKPFDVRFVRPPSSIR